MIDDSGPLGNRFQMGDRVRILDTFGHIGRVVEIRGPLGPGGAQVYRVAVGTERPRNRLLVLERQIELAPKVRKPKATDPNVSVPDA